MRGVPLTPEQRAARRDGRLAFARRVALRSVLGTLALLVLIAVAAWWLLTTMAGRDLLLRQIVAQLPAGTTLVWARAQGPASGPLTLHDVRFAMPRAFDSTCVATAAKACATGLISLTARTITIDPALRPLLGRRLQLDALRMSGATLELPDSNQSFELPRWPDSLPQIAPPLALQADRIRIDDLRVTRDAVPRIDIRHARGGVGASRGQLHIEHLVVDSNRGRFTAHGDYVPRDDYRTDLTATAVLTTATSRTPPRLGLVARGDLSTLAVAVAGNLPAPLRATLTLRGKNDPRWWLRVQSAAFDPALLTGAAPSPTPLALSLRADGVGGNATLQGRIAHGEQIAVIAPSQVVLRDRVLSAQPLVVDIFGGRVTLRGRADLRDPKNASLRLAVNARQLTWGGSDRAPSIRADADFGIAGKPEAWRVIGSATLLRAKRTAALRFEGSGDPQRIAIRSLRVTMPSGALDANGTLRWSPGLQWNLRANLSGFDPGYLFTRWDGALVGRIASTGRMRTDGRIDATVDVPELGGRLRGRPLQAHGRFGMQGDAYRGDVALTLGDSRVDAHGTLAGAAQHGALAIDARFSPLNFADLLPDAGGTLRGMLQLTGTRAMPDVQANLSGTGLRYGNYRADSLLVKGRLPWRGNAGALTLNANGLDAGYAFDELHIAARGMVEALQLHGNAQGAIGAVAFAGRVAKRGAGWRGAIDTLQLAPTQGATWQLQAPARFAQDGANWTLSRSCFTAGGNGTLCAVADWPSRGLEVEGQRLPLTLATPYLPARTDGRLWLLRGDIGVAAQVRPLGHSWRGTAHVASASGGLRNSERSRGDLIAYDNLVLDATFDPQQIQATLAAALNGNGRIDVRVATARDAYAPLSGDITIGTDALTWMELLSPDIVEPTGRLEGHLTLAGTRAQPAIGGQARLTGFATELPALAIKLTDGNVRLDAQSDGSARIGGSVRSGEGLLNLDGTLGWRGASATGATAPLVLNVRGSNVLACDTRDLRAVIDPDVVVRYAAGQPLDISGRVGVPSARIDLERLDRGAATSTDVVVLDPVDGQRDVATPLALDLILAMGDDVRLNGFGLTGTLGGSLRVRSRPEREMSATGTLNVGGQYLAYGQKLEITRGRLVWSNTPIADPLLDIRAQRDIGAVTAGIDVSGHATRPQATVWTDPATDQSQALAYLALGRPLSSASSNENRQLDAASAALSAGGNLLASKVGARLGLDNAGVSDSRALGGSVLDIGKFLSPKLYVGYGVSLLGTGQVLTLKYLLRKGFDIEVESSTIENRASANWRKEK